MNERKPIGAELFLDLAESRPHLLEQIFLDNLSPAQVDQCRLVSRAWRVVVDAVRERRRRWAKPWVEGGGGAQIWLQRESSNLAAYRVRKMIRRVGISGLR